MMKFEEIAESYVAERMAIGLKCVKDARIMARIATLHEEMGCPDDQLPKRLVEAWVEKRPGETETNRLHRVSHIRGLASYMTRMGYEAYVIPGKQGYADRGSYEPRIFTDQEVASLLAAADDLSLGNPVSQKAQMALILRLLYSSGLRCGEACGLTKAGVDLDEGVLTLRHSKNDKDRRVPMHPAMADRLREFGTEAALSHPQYGTHDLFWSLPEGRRMSTSSVYHFFRKALWAAGISHGGRGKGPRVHDLRFTFACHRLREWVREGEDVNAMLPVLAAYMGHADTRCTEYYLRLTADLYPGMVAQVERECGWVVPS